MDESTVGSMEDYPDPMEVVEDCLTPAEGELNETRYAKLIDGSRFPITTLLKQSLKEDTSYFLPRVLLATLNTMRRIPRSILLPRNAEREDYIFETFEDWAKDVCRIGQIKLEVSGSEKIDPKGTYLFVSNHLSPADIPVLMAVLPARAGFVANGIFRDIPVLSYWMRQSGAVFVNQGDPKEEIAAFKTMVKRLKRGRSLILFPEGFIYQGKGVGEFKRGGVHAAILAHALIVPVCLRGTQTVLRPGGLRVVPRKRVTVEFGEPIDPDRLGRQEKKNIETILHDTIAAMKARV
jgi:1-acyl-sn-glycerol-3-phosphate acyltransferase